MELTIFALLKLVGSSKTYFLPGEFWSFTIETRTPNQIKLLCQSLLPAVGLHQTDHQPISLCVEFRSKCYSEVRLSKTLKSTFVSSKRQNNRKSFINMLLQTPNDFIIRLIFLGKWPLDFFVPKFTIQAIFSGGCHYYCIPTIRISDSVCHGRLMVAGF